MTTAKVDVKKDDGMFPSEFATVAEKSGKKWLSKYAKAVDSRFGLCNVCAQHLRYAECEYR